VRKVLFVFVQIQCSTFFPKVASKGINHQRFSVEPGKGFTLKTTKVGIFFLLVKVFGAHEKAGNWESEEASRDQSCRKSGRVYQEASRKGEGFVFVCFWC
jgi:hypothetical protein